MCRRSPHKKHAPMDFAMNSIVCRGLMGIILVFGGDLSPPKTKMIRNRFRMAAANCCIGSRSRAESKDREFMTCAG